MVQNDFGRRLSQFKYNLKYIGGNISLKSVDFISQV